MRLVALIRLGFYWLRSRYAPRNTFVRCRTCPHWLRHSRVDARLPAARLLQGATQPLSLKYIAGLCLKDAPRVFNDFTTGYALRVWTGDDWCHRHPLYDAKILQGSDLAYRPGAESYQGAAGFSRQPSFAEAVQLAVGGKVPPNQPIPPAEPVPPTTTQAVLSWQRPGFDLRGFGGFGREHKRAEFKFSMGPDAGKAVVKQKEPKNGA